MQICFTPEGSAEFQANWKWDEFINDRLDLLFCYGSAGYILEHPEKFKNRIYWETDDPNTYDQGLPHERTVRSIHGPRTNTWNINYWTKILDLCPYSTKWSNEIYSTDKFIQIPCFFDPKYNKQNEKIYSVCYVGGLHTHNAGNLFMEIAKEISMIPNHRIVSYSNHPLVTDFNVSYDEKIIINSKTKITVAANLLQVTDTVAYHAMIRKLPNYKNNEAFKLIEHGIMPQMKTRVLEAAATKSLVLVLFDDWNIIEQYFKPDIHFIYFEHGKLKEKIEECLSNWNYCEKIIDNMFNHYMENYTLPKIYNNFLKQYDGNF